MLASSQLECFINKQILGSKKAAETSDKRFHITLNSVAGTDRNYCINSFRGRCTRPKHAGDVLRKQTNRRRTLSASPDQEAPTNVEIVAAMLLSR